jgi:hypothetical protein
MPTEKDFDYFYSHDRREFCSYLEKIEDGVYVEKKHKSKKEIDHSLESRNCSIHISIEGLKQLSTQDLLSHINEQNSDYIFDILLERLSYPSIPIEDKQAINNWILHNF